MAAQNNHHLAANYGLGRSLVDLPPHANKVGPCNGLELCNMQICPDCANVRVRDDFVLFAYEACLLWCTGRIHLQLLAQGWILHSVQIGYIFSYPRLKFEVDFGSERYYRLRRLASKSGCRRAPGRLRKVARSRLATNSQSALPGTKPAYFYQEAPCYSLPRRVLWLELSW